MNAIDTVFDKDYNMSMKWIIPREKLINIKNGVYCKSDAFQAGLPGATYALWIYPNGPASSKEKVHIYLEVYLGMMQSIECNYSVKIKSAKVAKNFNNTFTPAVTSWGGFFTSVEEFFKIDANFFVDDKVSIELEGVMKGDGFKIADKRLPIFKVMAERSDMDATVVVGEQKIMAHKKLLTKISPIFMQMLKDAKTDTIEIKDFSYQTVKTFIDFCYSKDITDNQMTDTNAIRLLSFADKFQVENFKNTVEGILVKKLSDETVTHFANLSVNYNAEILREFCICYLMLKEPAEIANIKNWEKLDTQSCEEIISRAFSFVSKKCV